MQVTIHIPFARDRVLRDEISRDRIANAYLAVLAEATQLPLVDRPPEEVVEQDWSDYEYPSRKEYLQWGDPDCGLRLITSAHYIHHGRQGGWLGYWIFQIPSLRKGRKLAGQSNVNQVWHSYADLTVEGSSAWSKSLKRAFERSLQELDQRHEPEGRARALLEQYLTALCRYSRDLLELDMAALKSATPARPSPVVSTSRFLQALARARRGEQPSLAGIGDDWAYGIATRYETDGRPAGVVWNDEFPPHSARGQVRLLEAALAFQRGDLGLARQIRQQVLQGKCSLARQGAAQMLIPEV